MTSRPGKVGEEEKVGKNFFTIDRETQVSQKVRNRRFVGQDEEGLNGPNAVNLSGRG